jgi:curli biogenesis system outer membrane secretion channel CsgG
MRTKFAATLIVALGPWSAVAQTSDVREREISVPKCAQPVAKIVVSEIKCKSFDCDSGAGRQDPRRYRWWEYAGVGNNVRQPSYTGVGTGMTDMLSTALSQTGCFEVMERAQLDEINQELALVGKKVQAEAADFMVTGSITSLGFEQSSTGLGGLAGYIRGPLAIVAGGVDWKSTKVHMNMDLRVVDINRAKLVGSRTFQADNQRKGFGFSAMGWAGIGLGGSHASISGSPLEEVARDLLVRSTVFITDELAARHVSERVTLKAQEPKAKTEPAPAEAGTGPGTGPGTGTGTGTGTP